MFVHQSLNTRSIVHELLSLCIFTELMNEDVERQSRRLQSESMFPSGDVQDDPETRGTNISLFIYVCICFLPKCFPFLCMFCNVHAVVIQ